LLRLGAALAEGIAMTQHVPENLRRLLTQLGCTLDEVAQRSGLDRRTIRGILEGSLRPPARTLPRLAQGLGVSSNELFLDPSQLLYRHFDRQTNPVVAEVVQEHPEIFAGWTEADFDELHSRVGTGGPLTTEGTTAAAVAMNRNRGLHEKLALLLETGQADLIRAIVETMYDKVVDNK
jgi:transcriptional regulator with XRE-family HTH domain